MSTKTYFDEIMECKWADLEEWKAINKGEGLQLELKSRTGYEKEPFGESDKAVLSKAISGLANTAGGVIAIGFQTKKIDDVEHIIDIVPILNAEKFRVDIEACLNTITEPPVKGIDIKVVPAPCPAESGIVLICVPPSDAAPHRAIRAKEGSRDHYFMRTSARTDRIPHRLLAAMFGQHPPAKLQIVLTIMVPHKMGAESMLSIALRIRNTGRGCAQMPGLRIYEVVDGPIPRFWWNTLLPGRGTTNTKAWDVEMMQDFDGPAYLTLRSRADTVIYPGDEVKVAHGEAGLRSFFLVPDRCEIPLRGLIFALNSQPVAFDTVLEIKATEGYRTDLLLPSE